MNMTAFLKKWPLPLVIVVCVCIIILTTKPLSSVTPTRQEIPVQYETKSLQVTSAEILNQDFKLVVRNVSEKAITSFEVGMGNGVTYHTEFLYADTKMEILPGQEYQETYAVEDGLLKEGLTVLAVIFEDGTSNGDAKTIKQIRDKREGVKIQLNRIIPLLEDAINASPSDMRTALLKLESQISSLQNETNQTSDVRSGLHSGKERMLGKIQKLQETQSELRNSEIKNQLVNLKAQQERIISKL